MFSLYILQPIWILYELNFCNIVFSHCLIKQIYLVKEFPLCMHPLNSSDALRLVLEIMESSVSNLNS